MPGCGYESRLADILSIWYCKSQLQMMLASCCMETENNVEENCDWVQAGRHSQGGSSSNIQCDLKLVLQDCM